MCLQCDPSLQLWRYNVTEPPAIWEAAFKSPEYQYLFTDSQILVKNQANLYFFYDNKNQCLQTGCVALNNLNSSDNGNRNKVWITRTNPIRQINVLDLSCHISEWGDLIIHDTPLKIIDRLDAIGIDVLTDCFSRYLFDEDRSHYKKVLFSDLRDDYCRLRQLVDKPVKTDAECVEICSIANRVNSWFEDSIGHLGQFLTDFENGTIFKEMLTSRGFDGYAFQEEADSKTFCIFDPNLLSAPVHEEVTIGIPD